MKNGKLMQYYLDACAEDLRLQRSDDLELLEELNRRLEAGVSNNLAHAVLADGWTMAEIDAAYNRRFGVRVRRGR